MTELPAIYHPCYSQLLLPSHHRFPIGKYSATKNALASSPIEIYQPCPADTTEVAEIHDPLYVQTFVNGSLDPKAIRRIGFPWSENLVQRTLTSLAGTLLTCEKALEYGVACHLGGGYHHAFYQQGSGFCIFNDLVFAAKKIQQAHDLHNILIFDLDVHQGDGTAAMAQSLNGIITCSVHCEKNFPSRKQQSDLDFGLANHTTDADYLQTVEEALELAIRLYSPDLIIYDAGIDIHKDDGLGLFNVSTQGLIQREHLVLQTCKQAGIPVATVMGGGYQDEMQGLVNLHSQVFLAAQQLYLSPLK